MSGIDWFSPESLRRRFGRSDAEKAEIARLKQDIKAFLYDPALSSNFLPDRLPEYQQKAARAKAQADQLLKLEPYGDNWSLATSVESVYEKLCRTVGDPVNRRQMMEPMKIASEVPIDVVCKIFELLATCAKPYIKLPASHSVDEMVKEWFYEAGDKKASTLLDMKDSFIWTHSGGLLARTFAGEHPPAILIFSGTSKKLFNFDYATLRKCFKLQRTGKAPALSGLQSDRSKCPEEACVALQKLLRPVLAGI